MYIQCSLYVDLDCVDFSMFCLFCLQHYDAVVPRATRYDNPPAGGTAAPAVEGEKQPKYWRLAPNIIEVHQHGCVETYVNIRAPGMEEPKKQKLHKRTHTEEDIPNVASSDTEFFESFFIPPDDSKCDKSWTCRARHPKKAALASPNPLGARRTRTWSIHMYISFQKAMLMGTSIARLEYL